MPVMGKLASAIIWEEQPDRHIIPWAISESVHAWCISFVEVGVMRAVSDSEQGFTRFVISVSDATPVTEIYRMDASEKLNREQSRLGIAFRLAII